MQEGEHSSVQDSQAAVRLYMVNREKWEEGRRLGDHGVPSGKVKKKKTGHGEEGVSNDKSAEKKSKDTNITNKVKSSLNVFCCDVCHVKVNSEFQFKEHKMAKHREHLKSDKGNKMVNETVKVKDKKPGYGDNGFSSHNLKNKETMHGKPKVSNDHYEEKKPNDTNISNKVKSSLNLICCEVCHVKVNSESQYKEHKMAKHREYFKLETLTQVFKETVRIVEESSRVQPPGKKMDWGLAVKGAGGGRDKSGPVWECSTCTFHNDKSMDICVMCRWAIGPQADTDNE